MTSLPTQLHLSMTLCPTSLNSTPPIPPFLALFPVKVNYHSTGLGLGLGLGFRRITPLSTPPFRDGRVRAGKSLVEDEEGLSEWVNELKAGTEKGRGDNSRNVGTSRTSNGNSREKPYNSRGGLSGISRENSRFGNREGRGGSSYNSSRENTRFEGRESRGGNSYNSSRGSSRFGSREGGSSREGSRFGSREGDSLRGSSRYWSGEGSSPRENSRFGNREDDSSRGNSRFGSGEGSSSRESSRFGSREGDSSRGNSRFGSREGGLRGGSSSRNTSGSSRFGGGVERRNGGSVRGRGGGGGRMSSRGGRGGRGRDAFVLEEEVVDEEVFGVYDTRKGREVKEVSGFMDLIGEGDSEEDDVTEFETETETESEGEEVEGRTRTSFFANEGVNLSSAPSSEGTVGSYLSETRFVICFDCLSCYSFLVFAV